MRKVGKLTNTWKKALNLIEQGKTKEAVQALDTCLVITAIASEKGEETIDGVNVDLWKTRAWVKIEDLGVLPEANDWYETQKIVE